MKEWRAFKNSRKRKGIRKEKRMAGKDTVVFAVGETRKPTKAYAVDTGDACTTAATDLWNRFFVHFASMNELANTRTRNEMEVVELRRWIMLYAIYCARAACNTVYYRIVYGIFFPAQTREKEREKKRHCIVVHTRSRQVMCVQFRR